MYTFQVLCEDDPKELLQSGSLHGSSVKLKLSTITEHITSRTATILKADSIQYGSVALKIVFAPNVRKPHNLRKEARILAEIDHPNVSTQCFLADM